MRDDPSMPQTTSGRTNRAKDSNASSLYERPDFLLIWDFYFGLPISFYYTQPTRDD